MAEKPKQPRTLCVHFVGDERRRLKEAAQRDKRTMSSLVRKFICDGLDRVERQQAASGNQA